MRTEIARDIDQLPPDQRAVLALVLMQGRSYADVAALLGMSEPDVRERAHAALDALASVSHANGTSRATAPAAAPAAAPPRRGRGSSKTAGAVLLGLIVAGGAVAAIALTSSGKGPTQTVSNSAARSSRTPASTAASEVHLDKRFSLTSTSSESRASGEGLVVSQGSRRAFYVTAQGLPPSSGFFYAVWLYNSQSDAWPLGRAPKVGANGRLEGGGPLSAPHPARFRRLVITRETNNHPSAPGEIVLSGPFALR